MSTFGDLNLLIDFAKKQGVSLRIDFWESDGSISVEAFSAAPAEDYGQKRIINVETFINNWKKHMADRGFKLEEGES